MNLNKVILIGRLTQDPDSRSTSGGQNVTTIRMATNRVWKDPSGQRKDATEYHTVIAWGRLGDVAAQYLKKGGLVMIEGRIQTRNWTDQNNVKKYYTEIIAENLQLGPRSAGGFSEASPRPAGSSIASQDNPKGETSSSYGAGNPMTDIKNPSAHSINSGQASSGRGSAVKDNDIPIIDENEPMNAGVEEDEMKIKEEDLPF